MFPRAEVLPALTELATLVYNQVYDQHAEYQIISYGASRCYEKTTMAHCKIALDAMNWLEKERHYESML